MKKLILVGAAAMLFTLAGCSDATAGISNGDKAIITIGKQKITNDDLYQFTKKTYGSSLTLAQIMDKVADRENIKITDELEKQANEQVAAAKESMGENFETQLKAYGYETEEDFKEGDIYPALRQSALVKKYVTSKKTSLFKTYTPVKAEILEAADADKANAALEAIKGGTSVADAATANGTVETYKGEEAIYTNKSGLPSAVFDKIKSAKKKGLISTVIEDSTTQKFYVVNVTNTDPTTFEEEAVAEIAMKGSTELQSACNAYYLKKYDFTIYDKDVYDGIKSTNADYIMQ